MAILMYKKPVVLDREVHRNIRLKSVPGTYSFATSVNSVPLLAGEFLSSCREYPIIFSVEEDGSGLPLALLGVRENENLFVNADGNWEGEYIPASIRCYPFALHQASAQEESIIIMDADFPGLNDHEGMRLFEDDGTASAQLQKNISFLQQFHTERHAAIEFVKLLKRHDLLAPHVLDMKGPDNKKFGLNSFYVVDENRLRNLSDTSLLELARSGALRLIYAHMDSLNALPRLAQLLEPRMISTQAA